MTLRKGVKRLFPDDSGPIKKPDVQSIVTAEVGTPIFPLPGQGCEYIDCKMGVDFQVHTKLLLSLQKITLHLCLKHKMDLIDHPHEFSLKNEQHLIRTGVPT